MKPEGRKIHARLTLPAVPVAMLEVGLFFYRSAELLNSFLKPLNLPFKIIFCKYQLCFQLLPFLMHRLNCVRRVSNSSDLIRRSSPYDELPHLFPAFPTNAWLWIHHIPILYFLQFLDFENPKVVLPYLLLQGVSPHIDKVTRGYIHFSGVFTISFMTKQEFPQFQVRSAGFVENSHRRIFGDGSI